MKFLGDEERTRLRTQHKRDIVAYVKVTFDVTYTVHGMRNWLQRHGFSYKKPSLVPGKANEQQQRNG